MAYVESRMAYSQDICSAWHMFCMAYILHGICGVLHDISSRHMFCMVYVESRRAYPCMHYIYYLMPCAMCCMAYHMPCSHVVMAAWHPCMAYLTLALHICMAYNLSYGMRICHVSHHLMPCNLMQCTQLAGHRRCPTERKIRIGNLGKRE